MGQVASPVLLPKGPKGIPGPKGVRATDMETARVENKRSTFITLPAIAEDISTPEMPNRFREIYPELRLEPGSARNDVDPNYLAILANGDEEGRGPHPTYRMWLEAGYFSVTMPGSTGHKAAMEAPVGPTAPDSLVEYGEPTALALVKAETDRGVLLKWQQAERGPNKRDSVKAAIAAKLG